MVNLTQGYRSLRSLNPCLLSLHRSAVLRFRLRHYPLRGFAEGPRTRCRQGGSRQCHDDKVE